MKNNRLNQTRNEQGIRDTSRDFCHFNRHNILGVPPEVKKEGYVYKWINTNIRGIDEHKVQTAMWNHWVKVPADRSSVKYYSRSGRDAEDMNVKDVVLMEREEEWSKQDRQYQNQIAQDRVSSLRGVSYAEDARPYFFKTVGK